MRVEGRGSGLVQRFGGGRENVAPGFVFRVSFFVFFVSHLVFRFSYFVFRFSYFDFTFRALCL